MLFNSNNLDAIVNIFLWFIVILRWYDCGKEKKKPNHYAGKSYLGNFVYAFVFLKFIHIFMQIFLYRTSFSYLFLFPLSIIDNCIQVCNNVPCLSILMCTEKKKKNHCKNIRWIVIKADPSWRYRTEKGSKGLSTIFDHCKIKSRLQTKLFCFADFSNFHSLINGTVKIP